jgi:hypothetical protein
MPFSQPTSGDWFKPKDISGHLILVTKVHEVGERYDNLSGRDKPYAIMDYVDLDEPGQELHAHVNDNHPGVANKLVKAHRTGEMVLGRITQVPSDKGNPAWVLGPYVEGQDDQRALAWVNAHPINNFGQQTTTSSRAAAPRPQPPPAQQYAPQPPAVPAPVQQQYAPSPPPAVQPQPALPQTAAAQLVDVNNLPPEVAALLASIQTGQPPPATP